MRNACITNDVVQPFAIVDIDAVVIVAADFVPGVFVVKEAPRQWISGGIAGSSHPSPGLSYFEFETCLFTVEDTKPE